MRKARKTQVKHSKKQVPDSIALAASDPGQLELPVVLPIESLPISPKGGSSLPTVMASDVTVSRLIEGAELPVALNEVVVPENISMLADDMGVSSNTVAVTSIDNASLIVVDASAKSLGARLRATRELQALSRDEVARRLHVPPIVIADIENERWDRLGAAVYIRGHLINYVRVLGLSIDIVDSTLQHLKEPAPLMLAVAAEPSPPWVSRHVRAVSYAVLTLLLAIPVLTLVPKRGVNSSIPEVQSVSRFESAADPNGYSPVDYIPGSTHTPSTDRTLSLPTESVFVTSNLDSATSSSVGLTSTPVMASMAPMAEVTDARPILASGQHQLRLVLSADSWVEVMDAQGMRLEYGMLKLGDVREYVVEGSVTLNFGNASGVTLSADGEVVDLLPYTRLNVARVNLFAPAPTTNLTTR